MVGMGFRQITDRFQVGFFLIYSSAKTERLSAKWLNEQQPSLRASTADWVYPATGTKGRVSKQQLRGGNVQPIVGLLKKSSPPLPISVQRWIHKCPQGRLLLLRNAAFSFCNSAWKFLWKLCVSQNVVIAPRCKQLRETGGWVSNHKAGARRRRPLTEISLFPTIIKNRSENKFGFDVRCFYFQRILRNEV